MKKPVTLLALFLFCLNFVNAQEDKKGIEKILGDKQLPSIELMDVNGKKINVADYGKSGHITILSFWATWCVPCKKELTNINDLYEEWKKKYNLQLVAVSIDDSRSAS